jgi:hypothetical protein
MGFQPNIFFRSNEVDPNMGSTRLAETHLVECCNSSNTISRKPQLDATTIGRKNIVTPKKELKQFLNYHKHFFESGRKSSLFVFLLLNLCYIFMSKTSIFTHSIKNRSAYISENSKRDFIFLKIGKNWFWTSHYEIVFKCHFYHHSFLLKLLF